MRYYTKLEILKGLSLQIPHIPVLFNETISAFSDTQGGYILDCTLGYAGHSQGILQSLPNVHLIACDRDNEAINFSSKRLENFKDRVQIHKAKFSEILKILPDEKIKNIRGILADIGVSSLQIDKNERGFGLGSDELDMRMDSSCSKDAKFIVNNYTKDELARILREYGELPNAYQIAEKIIQARKLSPITSAKDLAQIIGTKPAKNRSVSPAILAFQAIRIEVNNELGELDELLNLIEQKAKNKVLTNAKIAIISFHSLEDRIVKTRFKEWEKACICPEFALKCECGANHNLGKIISKKPITASSEELAQNSRASSAKLRIFQIK